MSKFFVLDQNVTWDVINHVQSSHHQFVNHVLESSKFYAEPLSALPTAVFFVFFYILLHRTVHRRTNVFSPFYDCFMRELCFQWAYLYVTRGWFVSIRMIKFIVSWSEGELEILHSQDKFLWANHRQIEYGLFFLLTCISMLPLSIIIINSLFKQSIPNFLMWVAEEGFERSEIGLSVHYLHRPPLNLPKRSTHAYRTGRSISAEVANHPRTHLPTRKCKSLVIIRPANSLDALLK